MPAAPEPLKEAERLAALEAYRVLDTEPERSYDDITACAAQLCDTPIALVSLVDKERQWFKSRVGLDATETPRDFAFCAHAILEVGPLVVRDATVDPRFADNPLVTQAPDIRFYAGAPLVTPEGHGLGTLCVIDREPRELDAQRLEALSALARLVVDQLEMRKANAALADALERVRVLEEFLPMCTGCKKVRGDDNTWHSVDEYLWNFSGSPVSHGVCPDCVGVYRGS
ncbi:MAG: GAF domain-containing protein [Planctomycetota bacterium]|nr:GAF domain-containing protein [Planctomycetota bacterium]